MHPDDATRKLRATLTRMGLAESDLGDTSATIMRRELPPQLSFTSALRSAVGETLSALPSLTLAPEADASSDLVRVREIGRGGMGVVHAALQRSIGREVAVKTTSTLDLEAVRALIREGRIMGALEHPSLVPVHALGIDEEGAPILVMKRIEGVSWRVLLQDPAHAAWAPLLVGHGDRLRASVEILSQLCRALAFAHERGVVHRDLKPDNVMIGRYGEVLLLDWGIALRLDERESEPEWLVGTPGYLAPEMALADPKLVDARTDVYLLGATLYELLTGKMLHDAPTALAAIASALIGDPIEFPAGVPRELAALVEAACAREASDRLASAEAFRARLEHYLALRDTDALVDSARAALRQAERASIENGVASPEAFRALVEARFGLAAALRARPGDAEIRAEFDAAIRAAIARELALRSPEAARALLADLSQADAALEARVDGLARELEEERGAAAALASSRREGDASAAVAPLTLVGGGGAVLLLVGAVYMWMTDTRSLSDFPPEVIMAMEGVAIGLFVAATFSFRRALLATSGTRRLAAFSALWVAGIIASDAVSYAFDSGVQEASAHALALAGFVAASAAMTSIREAWAVVLLHVVSVPLVVALPAFASPISVTTLALGVAAWIWAFRREANRTRVVRA